MTGVRAGDVMVVALLVAAAVGSLWLVSGAPAGVRGSEAVIEVNGREVHRFKLGADRRITVNGPLGRSVIEIKGTRVRMLRSPCRDKICVHTRWIDSAGQSVTCLPNRVVIRIPGRKVDSVTE